MKVLFMGTPDFSVGTLEAIIEAGHEVVGVVTQPDRDRGKGKGVSFSPVKETAVRHGIPVFQPVRIRKEPETAAQLAALQPDVGVVVAFGQILPKDILEIPKYGCLNVHASLLPAYRGAAPIQWSILDGCEVTGVTIMQMDEGLDTGDILASETIPILADETGGSLHDKLAARGAALLVQILDQLGTGVLSPVKQGETTTEYAKMLTKEMGIISWDQPAVQIDRQIRALSPWPSAYSKLGGKTLKVWTDRVVPEEEYGEFPADFLQEKSGKVLVLQKKKLYVKTGEGILELLEVQAEGKKRMPAADYLRGVNPEVLAAGFIE